MTKTIKASERNCRAVQAYGDQRRKAKRRGVDFQLTFAEWQWLWLSSGKWDQRGTGKGQYVMARRGDTGPYAVGNVFFQTVAENAREGNVGRATVYKRVICPRCAYTAGANIFWRHRRKCG